MRVGAIDIGSNSIRLLVADIVDPGSADPIVRTIARAGESCRLGSGLDGTGRIEDAMSVAAAAIAADFARRARILGATRILAGATAALRNASNGPEVAVEIGKRAGVPVRILSGEDEARLIYRSVIAGLGGAALRSPCVAFDLGGGSTEVVSGLGLESGRWVSLPFGAVNLTERYLSTNPPDPRQTETLSAAVRAEIAQQCASMPAETPILAGVGGTVTVLALMDRGLTAYEPGLIEGWLIQAPRLRDLLDRLVHSSQEERRRWPAMGEGRADIVVAGALAVSQLMERFPSRGLTCSTQGLRYGLVRLAAEDANGSETTV
jgi:exopolyphosphatase/guanosine-5'-triphosphate,3'-diphosphate pyrophosphatase